MLRINFAPDTSSPPIPWLALSVEPTTTFGALKATVEERLSVNNRVPSKHNWYYEVDIGAEKHQVEFLNTDSDDTLLSLGITDGTTIFLQGLQREDTEHLIPNYYLDNYPNQPLKALWEALKDSSITTDSIFAIILDARCGIAWRYLVDDFEESIIGYKINYGCTPLMLASSVGRLDVIQALISKGADVNAADEIGETPLHYSASNGHFACIELLISKGAGVNAADNDGGTPLHQSASEGYLGCIELLISKGADVNAADEDRGTPLHYATTDGHFACIKLLISKGADVNAVDKDGRTPLHRAATDGNPDCSKLLISKGSDVNAADECGETPLHYAATDGHFACIKLLISKGADVNAADKDGRTPLHRAATDGNPDCIELLISKGADVNAADEDGGTPLHYAATNGHFACIELLISKGAVVDETDKDGGTPLHRAATNGHFACIELLISKGAVVDETDEEGLEPLNRAANSGHFASVELLLSLGVDVNASDKDGWNALHYAARQGHLACIELLISKGADVYAGDAGDTTPLHYAANNGHRACIELLISQGADNVNAADCYRRTPLHYAASNSHLGCIELLISKGADVGAAENDGRTPLHRAATDGNPDCIELLISLGADVNAADKECKTSLHHAGSNGHFACIELLISKGADVNVADEEGRTPLHHAAVKGHLSCIETLSYEGADVNAADKECKTSLHHAGSNGHFACIELLISKGADVNAADEEGRTPLHHAAVKGHLPCIETLISLGADAIDIDARTRTGLTAIQQAVLHRQPNAVRALIRGGAKFDGVDTKLRTLMHLALELPSSSIIGLFSKAATRERQQSSGASDIDSAKESDTNSSHQNQRDPWREHDADLHGPNNDNDNDTTIIVSDTQRSSGQLITVHFIVEETDVFKSIQISPNATLGQLRRRFAATEIVPGESSLKWLILREGGLEVDISHTEDTEALSAMGIVDKSVIHLCEELPCRPIIDLCDDGATEQRQPSSGASAVNNTIDGDRNSSHLNQRDPGCEPNTDPNNNNGNGNDNDTFIISDTQLSRGQFITVSFNVMETGIIKSIQISPNATLGQLRRRFTATELVPGESSLKWLILREGGLEVDISHTVDTEALSAMGIVDKSVIHLCEELSQAGDIDTPISQIFEEMLQLTTGLLLRKIWKLDSDTLTATNAREQTILHVAASSVYGNGMYREGGFMIVEALLQVGASFKQTTRETQHFTLLPNTATRKFAGHSLKPAPMFSAKIIKI